MSLKILSLKLFSLFFLFCLVEVNALHDAVEQQFKYDEGLMTTEMELGTPRKKIYKSK